MSDVVRVVVDGTPVEVARGASLLEACRRAGAEVPTLCHLETLTPANACRLCSVEVEGARVLAAACSRAAEDGMVVATDSERVRRARRMIVELLASAVDLTTAPELVALVAELGADPDRYGEHRRRVSVGTVVDNDLYVRDLDKCVLCYRCVEACGDDAQHTYAITVAGRGFDAEIATEFDVPLPDSACVFCGNCVAVCPTGALMVKTEFDLRAAGEWRPDEQTITRTICGYCGVGCNLDLHVQDGRIVKVTSPFDHDVTRGNLCIKGRFGWTHVHA
ncbi:MAG TPA: Fe-S-binding domain-containing protein [Actinobacteria bacterium]|nr:Fe-S-binding domain-containing protein [Actinomycetota bacterium]